MNGKPDDEFAEADRQFKTLYERRGSEWGRKEPILVMLKTTPGRAFDERYSVIERNPYFCRKFVLDASVPERLSHELERLPFVPLDLATGEQRRPVAVQTLLGKLGVHKKLARFLAKPHERHETGIVDDCLLGLFDEPAPVPKDVPGQSAEIRADRARTRITHMEVSGFRAYLRPQVFDLDADIIVLYGPNGLGKTSFFDAIEFLCTGSVERLERRLGVRSRRLERALSHLDAPSEAWVSGSFSSEGRQLLLNRSVSERSGARVNAEPWERKQVLLTLAGLLDEDSRPDILVGNLVALFRATHFFGQEFQSLLSNLKSRSELPTEVVSRMLAYEDYVEATAKVEKVRAEITSRLDNIDRRAKELSASVAAKQDELVTLAAATRQDVLPEARLEETLRVGARMVTEATRTSISVLAGAQENQARGWRLLLEGELGAVASAIDAVRSMAPKVGELLARQKEQSELANQLEQLRARSQQLAQEHAAKMTLVQEKQAGLSEMQTRLSSLAAARDSLAWLVRAKPEANERQTASLRADTERRRVEAQLVETRLMLAKLTTERDGALKSEAVLEGGIQELERRLREFNSEVQHLGGKMDERSYPKWLCTETIDTCRATSAARSCSCSGGVRTARKLQPCWVDTEAPSGASCAGTSRSTTAATRMRARR